ncbi:MAG: TetR family transcriptional regulator [Parvibaculaceae bacterium]|nr:TetR family transcriptional regulator [Parvibaculaceae bacterium]
MAIERSKSDLTRTRILDAAARTFRQKGYAATTLNEIARAADMQAGSLYYHFGSKDELLEEVLDIGANKVNDAVRESQERLPPDASHRDRIRAAVDAHLTMLLKHCDYTSANISIFAQIPEEIQRRHLPKRDALAAQWRRILTRAQKAGALRDDVDLSMVRMLLLGALNWSVEWYKPGKTSIPAMADHICLMLLDGIGTENADGRRAEDREAEMV